MTDKKFLQSQANVIKQFMDKVSPISHDNLATVLACLGFRFIPKFMNNRLSVTPEKFHFSDWVGVFTTMSTGLIALSYGGKTGLKYWVFAQGIGNTIGTAMYELT